MECYETEHYLFHYNTGTKAARDITQIATHQENCFRHICCVLGITPEFKIKYFLCNSPEEVGRIYGDNDPCNGFTAPPDRIFAVYNEKIQCIGFHEDAHIISYTVNRPDCPAIREGLAMYFDRKWWGIANLDWTSYYLKTKQYISVAQLLNKDYFFQQRDAIVYPIMGTFTEWLISIYGIKNYMRMYRQQNMIKAISVVYKQTPEELNQAFVKYVSLFKCDQILEQRIEKLLNL